MKAVENREANDDDRQPQNYFFSIFDDPVSGSIRDRDMRVIISRLIFYPKNNQLVSATPGFSGGNPPLFSGPGKGKKILKAETTPGFAILNSLDAKQIEKTVIDKRALGETLTAGSRKAMINDPKGILNSELNPALQKFFMQSLRICIHRYNCLFALGMMREIETAGLNNQSKNLSSIL